MKAQFNSGLFGYKKTAVEEYIGSSKNDYEQTLAEHQERIVQLRQENKELKEELGALKSMEKQISYALISARKKADDLVTEGMRELEEKKAAVEGKLEESKQQHELLCAQIKEGARKAQEIAMNFSIQLLDLERQLRQEKQDKSVLDSLRKEQSDQAGE